MYFVRNRTVIIGKINKKTYEPTTENNKINRVVRGYYLSITSKHEYEEIVYSYYHYYNIIITTKTLFILHEALAVARYNQILTERVKFK